MEEHSYPLQEGVTVMLDKPRKLSLSLWAMYEAERDIERRLEQPIGSVDLLRGFLLNQLTVMQLLALLTAGLRQHDSNLTMEQVGKMIHLRQVGVIIDTVVQAWNMAMPEPEPVAPSADTEETTASPPS